MTMDPTNRQSFDFAAEGGLRVLQMRVAKLQQLEADIAFIRRHAPTAAEVCDAVGAYWRELGVAPEPWSLSDVLMHAARASHAAEHWESTLKDLTDILGISGDDRIRAAQQLVDEHRRLTTENERLRTALADATARLDSARHDLMAIGAAADAFHRDVGAERDSLTPAQIIAAAAQHYLDAEHLRSESTAIAAALSESPVPTCPPDCDLAGWIRYAVRGWLAERAEGNHLADLCQHAHNALTAAGVPNEGTPAVRIGWMRAELEHKVVELTQMTTERAQLRHERNRLLFEVHQLREQLASVQAPAEPEPMQGVWPFPPGGQDLAGSGDRRSS